MSPLQTAEKCSLTTTSNQQQAQCGLYLQKTHCQNTFCHYCMHMKKFVTVMLCQYAELVCNAIYHSVSSSTTTWHRNNIIAFWSEVTDLIPVSAVEFFYSLELFQGMNRLMLMSIVLVLSCTVFSCWLAGFGSQWAAVPAKK